MSGLPILQLLLDDGTGTFPHDITSRAQLRNGWSFRRGRSDEQSSTTAGFLRVTLDNNDGGVTQGSTVIASPSPITVDQKIRLIETINGTPYTRFTGYVKAWPVAWPAGVDTSSMVTCTATDVQARLERRDLRSVVEEEVLAAAPPLTAYYTLGEPAEATSAADSSGNQEPALTMSGSGSSDVVFGNATGPGTDGLTAAEFTLGGKFLSAPTPHTFGDTYGPATYVCVFATSATPCDLIGQVLLINPLGQVQSNAGGGINSSPTTFNDGEYHVAIVADDAVTASLYVDGALVDTGPSTPTGSLTHFEVGGAFNSLPNVLGDSAIAHVARYSTCLDAGAIEAISTAVLSGWDPDFTVDDIVNQIVTWEVPAGIASFGTFATTPAFADITGMKLWGLAAELVDAEGGLIYADGGGEVVLYARTVAVAKTAPDVTIDADFVTPDVQPVVDDQQIINYFESTAQGGSGVTQVVRAVASEATHGRYPETKSYLLRTDAEALDRANWRVSGYAEPSVRFGTLTIDLLGMTALEQADAIANLEPGAWLRVTNLPAQTPGGGAAVDLMVQGINEERSASRWVIVCNVVSRELFDAWLLEHTTRGVLDSTTKLYF